MTEQKLTATAYHRATSYHRHRLPPHTLDWAHQPRPVKRYPELPQVTLDRSMKLPAIDYFDLVGRCRAIDARPAKTPDHRKLSTVFRLAHEVTARSLHGGQPFFYRSVASAGALYPFELYLAVHRIDGMDPGVYHHDFMDSRLTVLRRGPVPEIPPADRDASATFYITGIFFRSAWKYRSRAYRYVLLDAGHLLENLRLALSALDIPFSIHLDFDDERAATLLGLDPMREVCLACVHLLGGNRGVKKPGGADGLNPLADEILQASTVSDQEVAYADILTVHRAGHPVMPGVIDAQPALHILGNQPTTWIDLDVPDHPGSMDYAHVLRQRRSRRNFIPASESRGGLMAFLSLMSGAGGTPSTIPPACRSTIATGLVVGAKMPVPPGFYLLNPETKRLGFVSESGNTEPMAAACLDQMWLKHAAVQMLFLTNLAALDLNWGQRGYRYAMIEAGRQGQQAYLAATALGWGVCGVGAIYDREAAGLLGLAAEGVLLYLVGAGPLKTR